MRFNYSEGDWLRHSQRLSLGELAAMCGLSTLELQELADYGVLNPVNPQEPQWVFSTDCMVTMRRACRMRDDLCLDTHAMALAYMLLDRIGTLEARVCALQAQVIPRLQ